jgi:pyruvate dehydrogenase E2 component (dihydrolipoamide acetyltransferase)
MAAEFTMPQLGLTMTEGTIVQWLKSVNDPVALGDLLVEVETEKVNFQVESTMAGVLLEILVPEGSIAPVKAPLAVIGAAGETVEKGSSENQKKVETPAVTASAPVASSTLQAPTSGGRVKASPLARRTAREQNVPLAEVEGSGPGGRIVERDILQHREENKLKVSPLAQRVADDFQVDLGLIDKDTRIMREDVEALLSQSPASSTASSSAVTVPLAGMRKVIAERLTLSWQNSPHVNMTMEVDMTAAAAIKMRLAQVTGGKISYNDIIVKCTAQALVDFPMLNSSLVDGNIVSHGDVHIGIAVALENGLTVPVVRNVNHKTIAKVRDEIVGLSSKARNGELSAAELSGGTFTITNLGMFGVDHFTPIINPPQSAILGVCRIVERPVAEEGTVIVRPLMNLCLSFDHRLVDGSVGAQFLARLRQLLEEPLLLL